MLVRASYTKSESLPYFTDEVNRTTRNLHFEDWGEFLVAWRRDVIELYRDHVSTIQIALQWYRVWTLISVPLSIHSEAAKIG